MNSAQSAKDSLLHLFMGIADYAESALIYGLPLAIFAFILTRSRHQTTEQSLTTFIKVKKAGLTEPASLHPLIDTNLCIGCGACVDACPEGNVLGLINNHAHLINPSHCIGHGACKVACPLDAISLVFGTSKRGVEIPLLKPNFETNLPGVFIAGELGGMGLIRNAVEQGRQAMEAVKNAVRGAAFQAPVDVLIIGAGPAGFSASLGAHEGGLKYVTIEQDSLGGTVFNFPRGKVVMTAPVTLPIVGQVKMTETSKEKLLQFWQSVEKKTGVRIQYQERMEDIKANPAGGYDVKTNKNSYHAKTILLAIGRRGTPRKLDVPGEQLPKVVYSLIDPEQYRGQHVLVVGGGNSALEAATSIAEEEGTTVTLSYRGDSFNRAAEKNRNKVDALVASKRLQLLLKSDVTEIRVNSALIKTANTTMEIPNQAVIISAGGVLPTPFLKKIGIDIETKYGAP
ncbi:MAG: NAD(P)-binding domain-containing protein [Gammaproteobacteria bacterium]|nr:NAD(P)-binding domain-containing protein [Gammaproteobacteria bacterium]